MTTSRILLLSLLGGGANLAGCNSTPLPCDPSGDTRIVARDEVRGSKTLSPRNVRWLTNGDFLLRSNKAGQVIGDGANEVACWTFDFCAEELIPVGYGDYTLVEALIALGVRNLGDPNPTLEIHGCGLSPIKLLPFLKVPPDGECETIRFDLIADGELSGNVLSNMIARWGTLQLRFGDDLSIYEAEIELVFEKTSD